MTETTDTVADALFSFDAFNLSEPVLRALREVGYQAPTPVQASAFEPIAAGRDVVVQARTGSGKTAAFVLPIVDRVLRPEGNVQALVLCPTRELALQVCGEAERLSRYKGISVVPVYGGAPMERQVAALRKGAQMVIGTPGRVLDHLQRGTLDPTQVRVVVLDEGDEMLSMGFAEELHAILEQMPKNRQGVILSATMPEDIRRIARRHLREPETLALSSDGITPEGIAHHVYFSPAGVRAGDLARILELERPGAALIFCNTKAETEAVARGLQAKGVRAEYIHGDLAQSDRERVLGALRDGHVQYLVATDVAARGIDVPHLTHVVNVGLPESAETYVHRAGRTGRAGRQGVALTLAGPRDIGGLYFLRLTYGIRPIERTLPSVNEERARRELDRVEMLVGAFGNAPSEESIAVARRLLTHDDAERIVASLVAAFFDLPRAEPAKAAQETPVAPPPPRERERERGPRREARKAPQEVERPRRVDVRHAPAHVITDHEDVEDAGMDELRLAVGRRDGLRAGDVLRLLADAVKTAKRDVGRIHLRDRFTVVNLRADLVALAIDALREAQWNDRPLAPERGRGGHPSVPASTEVTE